MSDAAQLHARALRHYQAGEPQAAESICWEVLDREPLNVEAIYLLGVLALDAGLAARALLHFHHATLLRPDHAPFHHALGEAQRAQGAHTSALESFRTSLELDPTFARAHQSMGLAQMDQGDLDEAVSSFRRSLALRPGQPRALTNLGQALHRRGELKESAECFSEAVRLDPDYAIAHNNLGAVLQLQGEFEAAISQFQRALALNPNYPEAHFNLGSVFQAQGDSQSASACFQEAIRLRPDYARAHHSLGQVLESMFEFPAALACYQTAVRLRTDYAEAYESLGNLLMLQPDWDGARAAFEQVLELQPENATVFGRLVFLRQVLCDWQTRDADVSRVWSDATRLLAAHEPTQIQPFCALTLPWTAEQQLAVARSHSDAVAASVATTRESVGFRHRSADSRGGRLRIGYLSCEFRDHAVSHLIQRVFGNHDRRGFEIVAYSFGPDDGSSYRQRIKDDCDQFRDLRACSLVESARCIANDRLHILVDLQGHIGYSKMSLLALRPAPVQVHFMGFPGTTGADFIDYLIGDRIVTPPESHAAYSEQLVILPHSYMPTDNGQPIAATSGTRSDHGLPEHGPVFCAFNNSYKIEPERFGAWMRILERLPGSVLWLSPAGRVIENNLCREAEARHVSGDRLIFARRVAGKAEHLARHQLADLFLDTAEYNGHTTAVDALWAGLPVLTCPGRTFASRVAASLLTNVGLPELIAADPEDYERKAVRLIGSSEELSHFRSRLATNRTSWPLFDTPRLTRNLEAAYRAMWDRYCAGMPPGLIRVTDPSEPS